VAEPIEVTGIGFNDATFEAMTDLETNFTLFEPVQAVRTWPAAASSRTLLAKIRPNMDVSLALEEICARHGIAQANIYGIGSLNGVRFSNGVHVDSHATEVLIRNGSVNSVGGGEPAELVVDVVDMKGAISSGRLVRGDNPVCVTFELVIEAVEGCGA
jgi:predicted DNA-binding protein with PD1-like motif